MGANQNPEKTNKSKQGKKIIFWSFTNFDIKKRRGQMKSKDWQFLDNVTI